MKALALTVAAAVVAAGLAGCFAPEKQAVTGYDAVIAAARAAAANVDTPAKARAAGYHPEPDCVPGMGVHWIHKPGQPDSFFDYAVDAARPEVLLFEPDAAAPADVDRQRFIGVEFAVVTQGLAPDANASKPRVLGVPLQGPMAGHVPGMPWHSELHVYLTQAFVSGPDFPSFHPHVQCPA